MLTSFAICNKFLTGGSNAGTSHLKRHHENCKTKNNVEKMLKNDLECEWSEIYKH